MVGSSSESKLAVDLKRLQLRSRRMVSADMLGNYRSSFKGSGLVYSDLREYQPGDDVKHIHWKASARTSKVFVKSYEEERQLRVVIAVDTSRSMRAPFFKPVFPRVLEFASLVATLTQRSNDLLGAALFSHEITSFSSATASLGQHRRIITLLSPFLSDSASPKELTGSGASPQRPPIEEGNVKASDLRSVCAELLVKVRKPSLLFIVSDFLTPPFDNELALLTKRHDVVLVHISDTVEAMPKAGLVTFTDAESGLSTLVDTSSLRIRTALNDIFAKRRSHVRAIAHACGADSICIEESVVSPLAALMNERTRRVSSQRGSHSRKGGVQR